MKRLLDIFRISIWAFEAYWVRMTAQVITFAGGVAAITLTVAILEGFQAQIDRLAFGAYATSITVRENDLVIDRHGPPRLSDLEVLLRTFPQARTAAWVEGRAQAQIRGQTREFPLHGAAGSFEVELDTRLAQGRWFTEDEQVAAAAVCIIGSEVARSLGASLGTLRLSGLNCQVVGILDSPTSRPAERFAGTILMPFRTAKRHLARPTDVTPDAADWITLILPDGTDMHDAEMRIDLALRRAHGAPLSRLSPYLYGDMSASLSQQTEQRALVGRMLMVISSIASTLSLVALISLAASILHARRREFALRLTMGADFIDISTQLIIEAAIIGFAGGVLGVASGYGLAFVTSAVWDWPMKWVPWLAAVAPLLGLTVGIMLGGAFAIAYARLEPAGAAKS